jgi:hypothetical protein
MLLVYKEKSNYVRLYIKEDTLIKGLMHSHTELTIKSLYNFIIVIE